MANRIYGFGSRNPTGNFQGISEVECVRRINVLVSEIQERKQRIGCGELYEYLLPEGSRMVNGNIFVRNKVGKLVCLGTRKEVIEKGLEGGFE